MLLGGAPQRADARMSVMSPSQLGTILADDDYVRRRTQPRYRDADYLQLADLYALMLRFAPYFSGDVFDYGCGGAPYRGLFNRCRAYVTADVTPGTAVQRLLREDGSTDEADQSYDLVLSTQVLEHVRDSALYLRECHRILRDGGRLLLTTHGMIEEHGCPYDFRRWTARGLADAVGAAGFRVVESGKLTTELRAIGQLAHQLALHLRCDGRPLVHYPLAVCRRFYLSVLMPAVNWWSGRFVGQAIVPGNDGPRLYTGIYVWAEKSASDQ